MIAYALLVGVVFLGLFVVRLGTPTVQTALETPTARNNSAALPGLAPPLAPRLSPERQALLTDVIDDTLGLRSSEQGAFEMLLREAALLPLNQQQQALPNAIVYAHVMQEPQEFRGATVTLQGELRALTPLPISISTTSQETLSPQAGLNPSPTSTPSLKTVYEGWLSSQDAPTRCWRVLATGVEASILRGLERHQQSVQVSGFFLKREGYLSLAGAQLAPTLIAGSILPVPGRQGWPRLDRVSPVAVRVTVGLCVALLVTILALLKADRLESRTLLERLHFGWAGLASQRVDLRYVTEPAGGSTGELLTRLARSMQLAELEAYRAARRSADRSRKSHLPDVVDAEFIDLPTPPPANRPSVRRRPNPRDLSGDPEV
jgi:hypothetical protein